MDGSTLGLIGGVIGSTIGIVGGAIGTYFSIKNTKGPIEKSFMVKFSIVAWAFIVSFILLLLFVPAQYKTLLWVVYGILLILTIVLGNKKLQQIRSEESNA